MIDKKLFDYYTGIKAVVRSKDWLAVDDKQMRKLSSMAGDDVKKGKKARALSDFKNESEYRIYLSSLVQSAWNETIGVQPSQVINE